MTRSTNTQLLSLPYSKPQSAGTAALRRLKKLTISDCNTQSNSPFFKTLPPELRLMIFGLALLATWHEPHSEEELSAVFRGPKGYLGAEDRTYCTVDTALLQTCRLIYLEAKFMPVWNDVHHIYQINYRRRTGGSGWNEEYPDTPHYGAGKVAMISGPVTGASSLVRHRKASATILAEVQQVHLYDVDREKYLTGHDFWGLKIKPKKVSITVGLKGYKAPEWLKKLSTKSTISGRNPKKISGWHDTLEDLKLRVDAKKKHRKELERYIKNKVVESEVTKVGGGILTLVSKEEPVEETWVRLDKRGRRVEWCSVTFIWRGK